MNRRFCPVDRRKPSNPPSSDWEDISRLNLPALTHGALLRAGVCRVETIRYASNAWMLLNVPGLGVKGLGWIREAIENLDALSIALTAEDEPEEPSELW